MPLSIGDPFTWMQVGGRVIVLTNVLEQERLARLLGDDADVLVGDEFGLHELLKDGVEREEAERTVIVRAIRKADLREALVPPDFPLAVADRLRAEGVEVRVAEGLFSDRRRAKSPAELAGIRRAQRAAEAGMAVAEALLRSADRVEGRLVVDGVPLTAETVRAAWGGGFTSTSPRGRAWRPRIYRRRNPPRSFPAAATRGPVGLRAAVTTRRATARCSG